MNKLLISIFLVVTVTFRLTAANSFCESCHQEITPEIVHSFNQGRMADGITCIDCHGQKHTSPDNADLAQMPAAATCAICHGEQVAHHQSGRHNVDLNQFPPNSLNYHDAAPQKECAACHRDSRSNIQADFGGGTFACLTCHRPHTFLTKKNKRPEICKTCHELGKNSAWQTWAGSPHGRLYFSETKTANQAPYCQTCHMNDGDHRMESRWGAWDLSLFIRDTEWQKSQQTIRRALFNDASPENTILLSDSIKAKRIRIRYRQVCLTCHTERFVSVQQSKADHFLKQADGLMGNAIGIVWSMKKDSKALLQRAANQKAQPRILELLQTMFYEHRRQVYHAALHANYLLTEEGLQKMESDLAAIKNFIRLPE